MARASLRIVSMNVGLQYYIKLYLFLTHIHLYILYAKYEYIWIYVIVGRKEPTSAHYSAYAELRHTQFLAHTHTRGGARAWCAARTHAS